MCVCVLVHLLFLLLYTLSSLVCDGVASYNDSHYTRTQLLILNIHTHTHTHTKKLPTEERESHSGSAQLAGDVIDHHLDAELVAPRRPHSQSRYQQHIPGTETSGSSLEMFQLTCPPHSQCGVSLWFEGPDQQMCSLLLQTSRSPAPSPTEQPLHLHSVWYSGTSP